MRYGTGRLFFPGLLLPTLLVCIVLSLAGSGAARADNLQDKAFSDWTTYTSRGKDTVFAMFTRDLNDKKIGLHLGKFLGNCGNTEVYVFVNFTSPAVRDYQKNDIPGEVRVDQNPAHKSVSRAWYKGGNTFGSYNVHSFENPRQLLDEMASGQTVRFRFTVDRQEYSFQFSLNGFKPAYDRMQQLCAQGDSGAGEKTAKPKSGHPKPKTQKSDSDFFDAPKQSGGTPPKTGGTPHAKSDKDFF